MRVNRISTLNRSPEAAKAALATVARETGVRTSTLQDQQQQYPVGSGGLLICNAIAKATGKPAATFLKQRVQGRDWGRIAADSKYDLRNVIPKLDRVLVAMENVSKKSKK